MNASSVFERSVIPASKEGVFLNPVPLNGGIRPRSFYSVDRVAIYLAMGFRAKDRMGDPKLPTVKNWRAWIKLHFAQSDITGNKWVNSNGWSYNNGGPTTWDNDSVDFGPLNLYNCRLEWINDKRFDALREEIREAAIKLYGSDSIRTQNIKPIQEFTLERTWIGRLNVKLMPPYDPTKDHMLFHKEKRKEHSFQRVLVQCPHCKSWQYFGRFNQHMYSTFSSVERSKICRIGEEALKLK